MKPETTNIGRVLAYVAKHPQAADAEIATALNLTRRQVWTARYRAKDRARVNGQTVSPGSAVDRLLNGASGDEARLLALASLIGLRRAAKIIADKIAEVS